MVQNDITVEITQNDITVEITHGDIALATVAPVAVGTSVAAVGTSLKTAREDHKHALNQTELHSLLDPRYLEPGEETDPIWTADKPNYYTKTQSDTLLSGKSDTSHNHSLSNLTEKSYNSLTDKPDLTSLHSHSNKTQLDLITDGDHDVRTDNPHSVTKTQVGLGNVTDDSQVKRSEMGAASGVATLGVDAKIPNSQLPALAITDTFVVISEVEMLALTAEVGDVAIRTDENKTYILQTTPPSVLVNWKQILTPSAPVQSVNGKTGNVSLTTSDISEGTNLYYLDSRARAAISANSPLSYNSGTGALSIQQANTSQAGYLSSDDWNTFSGKQSALGYTPVNKVGDTMSGLLQFSGTTHAGIKLNNLTTTQRDAIATPSAGMTVWNTTTSRLNVHDGSNWTAGFVRLAGDVMTGTLQTTGLISPYIKPSSDSTTAVQIQKSDGTNVLNVDTTNGRVGIGTTVPNYILQINKAIAGETTLLHLLNSNGGANNDAAALSFGMTTANNSAQLAKIRAVRTNVSVSGDTDLILSVFNNGSLGDTLTIKNTGNVGIGTTSPTNILSLGGNSARTVWMERHTTANTAGNNLTLQAGGATAAATDKAGGSLYLKPGVSTGTGESGVQIQGCIAGTTGTQDNTISTQIQVLGNKIGIFGVTPVVRPTALTASSAALSLTVTQTTPYGFSSEADWTTAQNLINNLRTRVSELETKLQSLGLIS